ncbi:hypothetical protein [Kitasatospora sp. NPDC057015]|uniref:hypothetical protein n=1 Tax=Kitasatospora sp. NPDC057015 TaxID=3346001 RepID=UPI0036420769
MVIDGPSGILRKADEVGNGEGTGLQPGPGRHSVPADPSFVSQFLQDDEGFPQRGVNLRPVLTDVFGVAHEDEVRVAEIGE